MIVARGCFVCNLAKGVRYLFGWKFKFLTVVLLRLVFWDDTV